MSEHDQAAPAGDGLVTATLEQPLTAGTIDSVAHMLMDEDDAPASEASASPEPEATETADTTPEGEDGEVEAQAEGDEEQPDEGEPEAEDADAANQTEPEGYDWEKVPGDAVFNLRDGTKITGAQIKQRWDDLQQATQQKEYLAQEYAKFQQQQAHLAQQAQQFFPVAQQAIEAIKASLPQVPNPPDRALLQTDPLRFHDEMANRQLAIEEYNAKVGQIQQIQGQAQAQQQRLQAEQQQRLKGYVETQREELFKAMPDLRDDGKRQEFYRDYIDTGTKVYGFSSDELNNVHDARLMRMAADAMKYRRLMSKGAPKPNAGAPAQAKPTQGQQSARAPVAQPGRRVSTPEKQANAKAQLMTQARAKPGGIDLREAATLLMLDD